MNRDKIIALTNKLSFFLIVLLLYWVFIFTIITVFDFKVFRENLTQTFFASIFGIISLLSGVVILNVMLNLTKIADALSEKEKEVVAPQRGKFSLRLALFILSFPIIFGLFYLGDLRTSHVKRELLLNSARSIVRENPEDIERLGAYHYNLDYLKDVEWILTIFEKQDENFRNIVLIVEDQIQGKQVFLGLKRVGKELPEKIDAIFSCSQAERQYLKDVFSGKTDTFNFSSSDGYYELYFPVKTKQRTIILYFTDYQRYGKFGS